MTQSKIEHLFGLAHNACYYSDNKRTRVGCVIVYKNKVLSVGYNVNSKTHPTQKLYNKYRGYDPNESGSVNSLHAECSALVKIRDMDIDWRKASIFVWRIKKDGSKGMARPCKACEAMLRDQGIKEIYYSTDSGTAYEKYDEEA